MLLFFDTETTGLPPGGDFVHMAQLAWILMTDDRRELARANQIVKPDGYVIPDELANIHGITTERALAEGLPLEQVMSLFFVAANSFGEISIVGHNVTFDLKIVRKEFDRLGWEDPTFGKNVICTMKPSVDLCRLPRKRGGFKWPKLNELYKHLFGCEFENAHNALADIEATAKCFWKLQEMKVL
jgi:DNA polymerase-3 subunit epsilon